MVGCDTDRTGHRWHSLRHAAGRLTRMSKLVNGGETRRASWLCVVVLLALHSLAVLPASDGWKPLLPEGGRWRDVAGEVPEAVHVMPTCLMTLALQDAGYDHRSPSRWRGQMRDVMQWLRQQVQTTADLDAIDTGTLALLAMVYANEWNLTDEPTMERLAMAVLNRLLERRTALDGFSGLAWPHPERGGHDLRLSLLAVRALTTAAEAELSVETALAESRAWCDSLIHHWQQTAASGAGEAPASWPDWVGSRGDQVVFEGDRPEVVLALATRLARYTRPLDPTAAYALDPLIEEVFRRYWPGGGSPAQDDPTALMLATAAVFFHNPEDWSVWNVPTRDWLTAQQQRDPHTREVHWPVVTHEIAPGMPLAGMASTTGLRFLTLGYHYRR